MRTLNRPMFNMGGPIKEGVMHGIREPYRGGQLVQPGPGRPGYAGKPPTSKLGIAGWLAKKVPFLKQPVKTISKSTKDIIPKTWGKIKNIYKGGPKDKGYVPPGIATNRWYWEKGIKPTLGLQQQLVKKLFLMQEPLVLLVVLLMASGLMVHLKLRKFQNPT